MTQTQHQQPIKIYIRGERGLLDMEYGWMDAFCICIGNWHGRTDLIFTQRTIQKRAVKRTTIFTAGKSRIRRQTFSNDNLKKTIRKIMDGPLEEPQQQQRGQQQEEEDDNESIGFVRIEQSEKDNSDQETSDQEEDHDQEQHHLVEGAEGVGGEEQERNLTDWTFDGILESSAGGQSAASSDNELVNLRMAALITKNQLLEEQLKNVQLQAQMAENGAKFEVLEEKNKMLESQLKNAVAEREKALETVQELQNAQLQAHIAGNDANVVAEVLKGHNKMLEGRLKTAELREKVFDKAKSQLLGKRLENLQLQAQITENGANVVVLTEKNKTLEKQLENAELQLRTIKREKTCGSCRTPIHVNSPVCPYCKRREEQLKNVQLQAQIADNGAKLEVLTEKNKTLESQLEKVELHEKALKKKLEQKDKQLEEKDKQVAQFTASLASLGKQLATLSGNSTKIELHIPPGGNNWNEAASHPYFTMNGRRVYYVPPHMRGLKWQHGFALKGFPVLDAIMKKGQHNNANNKTTVYYYEVLIVQPQQYSLEEYNYHAAGLSMGYNKDFADHVGKHPNSYGFGGFGQSYYVCGKIRHSIENSLHPPMSELANGSEDIYGFGLLVKPNKELAIFATINGMLVGQQVPIQFWSEFLYPTVSVSKLATKVEANFGNNPAVPYRYDIANCPGLQLE